MANVMKLSRKYFLVIDKHNVEPLYFWGKAKSFTKVLFIGQWMLQGFPGGAKNAHCYILLERHIFKVLQNASQMFCPLFQSA